MTRPLRCLLGWHKYTAPLVQELAEIRGKARRIVNRTETRYCIHCDHSDVRSEWISKRALKRFTTNEQ
jgi:hypothetical protein